MCGSIAPKTRAPTSPMLANNRPERLHGSEETRGLRPSHGQTAGRDRGNARFCSLSTSQQPGECICLHESHFRHRPRGHTSCSCAAPGSSVASLKPMPSGGRSPLMTTSASKCVPPDVRARLGSIKARGGRRARRMSSWISICMGATTRIGYWRQPPPGLDCLENGVFVLS